MTDSPARVFENPNTEGSSCNHCHSELSNPITHYVLVREDLPRGVLAAQIVHAAGESSPGGLAEGTYAVVLSVKDESSLEREAKRLRARGVDLVEIRETDAPYGGALMAIGLVPARKEVLRRHVASLPLLR